MLNPFGALGLYFSRGVVDSNGGEAALAIREGPTP
jgi:hypothetical protein